MPKEHELSDAQKAQIVALKPHFSHANISMQLNIQQLTMTKFVERFKNHKSIENLPRSGQPQKTSETGDRYIICNAKSNTYIPLEQLKNVLNINTNQ